MPIHSKNFSVLLATAPLLLFLGGAGCGPTDSTDPSQNLNEAAIIGWGDGIQTDVKLSEFAAGDFTMSAWTYPLVTNGMDMEIFGQASSSGLSVGFADHWAIDEKANCENAVESLQPTAMMAAKLYVQIGSGRRALYCVPVTSYQWHMISVISRSAVSGPSASYYPSQTLELWVDGKKMIPTGTTSDVSYFLASAGSTNILMTSDTIRLGRGAHASELPGGRATQYFGLLDDVSIFNKTLSASELATQIGMNGGRLTGLETGLLADFRFDPSDENPAPGTIPAPLTRVWKHLDPGKTISKTLVSALRNSAFDHRYMDEALPAIVRNSSLTLPIEAGVPWYVIQSIDTADGSHKGYGAFCWDFMYAGKAAPGTYPHQADTLNQPVHAAANGTIAYIDECNPLGNVTPGNVISENLDMGFFLTYMHLVPDSVSPYLGITEQCAQGGLQLPIATGETIGRTGDTGLGNPGAYHIHFAATNLPDTPANNSTLITEPTAFSSYQASDDQGLSWHQVNIGIPQAGQWVRR